MIGDNRTIKTLILSGNRFGDNEAKAIAEGLRQNDSIQNLDLSRNEIGDIGGIALGSGIQANGGLQDLNLAWNHMRPKGVTAILQGSKDNSNLVSLNISHNGIGDQANVLADFLAKTQLNKLDISYTRLSDQSGGPMLKGLDANRTFKLTRIDPRIRHFG
jgi:Ran GTPase-activating protein (RanGAP) involved in mRNA processing and transport